MSVELLSTAECKAESPQREFQAISVMSPGSPPWRLPLKRVDSGCKQGYPTGRRPPNQETLLLASNEALSWPQLAAAGLCITPCPESLFWSSQYPLLGPKITDKGWCEPIEASALQGNTYKINDNSAGGRAVHAVWAAVSLATDARLDATSRQVNCCEKDGNCARNGTQESEEQARVGGLSSDCVSPPDGAARRGLTAPQATVP